jgi:hypothetical protein
MADISIGSAVGAGFQLIARKPLTVMAWGLVRILFVVAVFALFAPVVMGIFAQAMQSAQTGSETSQAAVSQLMSRVMVMQGASLLLNIGGLFVTAILYCAISRAVVHPERGMAAYLRLGGPEFFVAILSFAAGFVAFFVILLCMIPFAIVVGILASQHLYSVMAIVIGLGVLVLFVGLIYVLLRLAFVVPMMVDDGQFHLFDAWTLTKGHVGSLFVIGLCLMGIAIAAELVIGAFLVALGVAALGAAAGGLGNLQAFFALGPAVIITRLAPWLIVYAVLAIPLEGCAMAIFGAPWARAYRDVAPPPALPAAAMPPPITPPPVEPPPVAPPPVGPSPAVA